MRYAIAACLSVSAACGTGGTVAEPSGDASRRDGADATTGQARSDGGGRGDSSLGDAGGVRRDGAVAPDPPGMFGAGNGIALTSGGGSGRSTSLRLQIAIGAPQPYGSGTSENLRLRLGGTPIR